MGPRDVVAVLLEGPALLSPQPVALAGRPVDELVGSASWSSRATSTIVGIVAGGTSNGNRFPVPARSCSRSFLRSGAEYVERVKLVGVVGRTLQRQQANLRSVTVGDDRVRCRVDRERPGSDLHVGPLRRRHRFAATQRCIAPEGYQDAWHQSASAATRIALIVCRRFSACSKAMFISQSKTSPVTSKAVRPNCS